MRFTELDLRGAFLVEMEPRLDERGSFARSFCRDEFERRGLNAAVSQCNVSLSHRPGTLRGLHYQLAPHAEVKLVRCVRGAVYDVLVDVRPGSPSLWRWVAVELAAGDGRLLYVPEGFAHGFQTLEPETEVTYQVSAPHVPQAERGLRWDDPRLGIRWPLADPILSERDRSHPLLQPATSG